MLDAEELTSAYILPVKGRRETPIWTCFAKGEYRPELLR